MKIGYIRVSTPEQHEALQKNALKEAGCEELFIDKNTRSASSRKGLEEALLFVRPGDTMVVWKLDCLSYSLKHLIKTLNILKERGVHFISLTEKIDTTTPDGQWTFHLIGILAEFERDLLRARTNTGLAAGRARGRNGGRPKKLPSNEKVILAQRMHADKSISIREICSTLGISRATLYRYVGKTGAKDAALH
jgi:DNA invertase Pin-like site-specific DNA recombinase